MAILIVLTKVQWCVCAEIWHFWGSSNAGVWIESLLIELRAAPSVKEILSLEHDVGKYCYTWIYGNERLGQPSNWTDNSRFGKLCYGSLTYPSTELTAFNINSQRGAVLNYWFKIKYLVWSRALEMLYTHALFGSFSSLNTVITPTEIPSVQELLCRNISSPSCLHSLKWNHVREQLDTFAAIASASKGGRIGIEEFAEYLKLPISDVLRELFLLFDRVSNWLTDLLTILC